MARRPPARSAPAEPILEGIDASLLDIVDHVLTKGIVLTGDLVLGVADIDLVYLRLSALLCAADRILGPSPDSSKRRTHAPDVSTPLGSAVARRLGRISSPRRRRGPANRA